MIDDVTGLLEYGWWVGPCPQLSGVKACWLLLSCPSLEGTWTSDAHRGEGRSGQGMNKLLYPGEVSAWPGEAEARDYVPAGPRWVLQPALRVRLHRPHEF